MASEASEPTVLMCQQPGHLSPALGRALPAVKEGALSPGPALTMLKPPAGPPPQGAPVFSSKTWGWSHGLCRAVVIVEGDNELGDHRARPRPGAQRQGR